MLNIFCRRINSRTKSQLLKRYFLSNAYRCTEAWENRLKNPAFKKINFDHIYQQLQKNFEANAAVNMLDIDLFVNSLTHYGCKDELESVLLKLRDCPECVLLPERTSHAVIRWYINNAPQHDIFTLLSNRLRFGIFPDYYLTNILMDKFLSENDAVSAVKIAVLQMLQEDFENPITKALVLYSCYNYLASDQVWQVSKPEENAGDDDDDEENIVKVRVQYIKNPYHDDHFDIVEPDLLVGKTLWLCGVNVGGELGLSSQLIGLVLYKKYEKCFSLLQDIEQKKLKIHKDAVLLAKKFLFSKPNENEAVAEMREEKKNETNSDKKDNSCLEDPLQKNILAVLDKLDKNLITTVLLSDAKEMAVKAVQENQDSEIKLQCQIYKQWESDRANHIEEELQQVEIAKAQEEIQRIKSELEAEEKKLFYFDKEDELELEILAKEEEMNSLTFYEEKKKKKETDKMVGDGYLPPDVSQRKRKTFES